MSDLCCDVIWVDLLSVSCCFSTDLSFLFLGWFDHSSLLFRIGFSSRITAVSRACHTSWRLEPCIATGKSKLSWVEWMKWRLWPPLTLQEFIFDLESPRDFYSSWKMLTSGTKFIWVWRVLFFIHFWGSGRYEGSKIKAWYWKMLNFLSSFFIKRNDYFRFFFAGNYPRVRKNWYQKKNRRFI